jgi:streptomycin 3"-kinase
LGVPALTGLLPELGLGRAWIPVSGGESGAGVFVSSDGQLFAKCVRASQVSDLRGEWERIEWLAATSVPCPSVVDWLESADGACLVTVAVKGVSAGDVPAGLVEIATRSIAEVVAGLHLVDVGGCPFDRRLRVTVPQAVGVVRRGGVDPRNVEVTLRGLPSVVLLERVQADLAAMQELESGDLVVCHGDACLPNFLLDPTTGRCVGLVDLGRLGVADRYLDLSLLVATMAEAGEFDQYTAADAESLLRHYGRPDPDEARLGYYRLLDALTWG